MSRSRYPTRQQRIYATPKAVYRSGLEEKISKQIAAAGHAVHFEQLRLPYVVPERDAKYTPDFYLDNGIIIETKGIFTTEDRQKMRLIREQHPDLDIRMVFSNANAKIAKQSKTTYAMWSEKYGFLWAHKEIPKEWLTEPLECARMHALMNYLINRQ